MKNLEGSTTKQAAMLHKTSDDKDIIIAETNSGEIKTIQNDSYSIKEIFQKFTTGVMKPEALMRSGESFEFSMHELQNSEVPEIIDMVDLEEYNNTLTEKVKEVKAKMAEKKAKAAEQAKAEAVAKAKEELATENARAKAEEKKPV